MEAINANVNDLMLSKSSVEIARSRAESIEIRQKKQAAKDFESLFVNKLLDSMKDTVDAGGIFEDPVGKQINDLFYSFLGEDISKKGGMGMWQDIYKMMDGENEMSDLLDEKI